MRLALLSLLLLAAAACSRSHAPAQSAGAKPPGPDATIAQTVPAGTGPASIAAAPVAVDAATGKPELPPDKSDTRWQDVDPNTLGGRDEGEMAKFLAEQRKRDAELMAKDADEANSRVAEGAPREDRNERQADPRDPRRYADERYADERYADPREDERRYDPRDDRRDYQDGAYGYDPEDAAPWDEGGYDEPPPYEDEDYPPPDEDYDPRYDPDYDPAYERPYR